MKFLVDLHHTDLYQGLRKLLVDRLGHEVYRPMGMEWYEKNYWKIADPYRPNHMGTVEQFLKPGKVPEDGTPPLNDDISDGVTFQEFLDGGFDAMIGSIPDHWEAYYKLREDHKLDIKLISQMGNRWQDVSFQYVENLMASTYPFAAPVTNKIFYHQEFDLDIFKRSPVPESKLITSFLNAPQNYSTYKLWSRLPELMSGWDFEEYGATARDGNLDHQGIAASMHDSRFVWQVKPFGDGFGHVAHSLAAMGRPPIIRLDDYKWTLAGDMFLPDVTCVCIDGLKAEDIAIKINSYYDKAPEMGSKLADLFYSKVDFDVISKKVEAFLDRLV